MHTNNDTLHVIIRGLFCGIENILIFTRKIPTKCHTHYVFTLIRCLLAVCRVHNYFNTQDSSIIHYEIVDI